MDLSGLVGSSMIRVGSPRSFTHGPHTQNNWGMESYHRGGLGEPLPDAHGADFHWHMFIIYNHIICAIVIANCRCLCICNCVCQMHMRSKMLTQKRMPMAGQSAYAHADAYAHANAEAKVHQCLFHNCKTVMPMPMPTCVPMHRPTHMPRCLTESVPLLISRSLV